MGDITLAAFVRPSPQLDDLQALFDYEFDGACQTVITEIEGLPDSFGIGAIVGPSGSGKSTLLKRMGRLVEPVWNHEDAVISHWPNATSGAEALGAAGLNSVPAWTRPYHTLSTGEKFRADVARVLGDGALIDEFSSTVDRNTAMSCSNSVRRYVEKHGLRGVVVAACHTDILPWLQPDWVYYTDTRKLVVGRGWERPTIRLEVVPCGSEIWPMFAQHHYLSASLNRSAPCWAAFWDGKLVGFASALPYPSGTVKRAYRGHRTVILPDFQGLGLGVRLSDAIAQIFVDAGYRYFSKTVHPRMGAYRENSPLWRPTSKNGKARPDYKDGRKSKESGHKMRHVNRVAFSHEFVGAPQKSRWELLLGSLFN